MRDRLVAAGRRLQPVVRTALLVAAFVILAAVSNPEPGPSGGGAGSGNVLLLVVAALVGAAITLPIVAFLVLRWRAGPAQPEPPGEWWACRACGAMNIAGSPRCHSCGEWQG